MMRAAALSAILLLSGCGGGAAMPGSAAPEPQAAASPDLGAPTPGDPQAQADLAGVAPSEVPIVDGGTGDAIVELVSPSVCRTQLDHLLDCRIGVVRIDVPRPAAALRVRAGMSGTCATQFDIDLSIRADDQPAVDFYPLHDPRTTTLRRADGGAIDALTIADVSPFAGTPAYDASCRLWIDVDSPAP
ncbi:MAG TPA: hypothetical protein VHB97_22565 [Polyangia bacterium]|nr:hypothetical protein [Polyangia bacterium]